VLSGSSTSAQEGWQRARRQGVLGRSVAGALTTDIHQLHAAVVENMSEGLYVVDLDGRLMMMNPAAERLLGWRQEDLAGRVLHHRVHHQRANGSPIPIDECALARAYRDGTPMVAHEDVFTRRDGSIAPVSCSVAPLLSGGRPRGAVLVFRDVTDEYEELARARRDPEAFSWLRRTQEALEEDRFELYAQPIVPLARGRRREELLLRMIGREGEVIAPLAFLPAAEKYGLIGRIDRWVVTRGIRWAAEGRCVELNLSAGSVGDPELLALIENELRASGADPGNLVFEITETALMHDVDAGEAFAHALAQMGCQLALDDFGTGFGSFTYLKRLPISYLKIDREFVRLLGSNLANQHLVKAIVNLARGFGQRTIAEGVEDEETLTLLREYGVDYAQGFHLGSPAPLRGARVA
jgi:PAS domain S-box-containing protein